MIGEFTLVELAQQLGLEAPAVDVAFRRVSTDTRTLEAGDLYVALSGAHFDGNAFIDAAIERGAAGVVSTRACASVQCPCLTVPDTLAAFAAISRLNRRRSAATLIALTGSQGKTSVKEMLGSILAVEDSTLITSANLNNTVGVPQTLLGLAATHRYAVIEMGANGAGEIAFSVAAAEPDVALITKASAAHIEGFGSLQGIVEAKGEIIDGLAATGVAVLNANDPNCGQWIARAGGRPIRLFSLGGRVSSADYRSTASHLLADGRLAYTLITPQGEVAIESALIGNHNVENALAAAACALEAGASLASVRLGLAQAQPVPGRLFPSIGRAGCRLLDDTYNASPDSFRAGIEVLMAAEGSQVLVAGEMFELGDEAEDAHRDVGEFAAACHVPQLLALGEQCGAMVDAYTAAGGRHAQLFASHEALANACLERAHDGRVFLIKGSRGARMEKIVAALAADDESAAASTTEDNRH
jgi:UDP-N-acetylmuramoyl-tripeptide--D-alanyl-D-alanine ligase